MNGLCVIEAGADVSFLSFGEHWCVLLFLWGTSFAVRQFPRFKAVCVMWNDSDSAFVAGLPVWWNCDANCWWLTENAGIRVLMTRRSLFDSHVMLKPRLCTVLEPRGLKRLWSSFFMQYRNCWCWSSWKRHTSSRLHDCLSRFICASTRPCGGATASNYRWGTPIIPVGCPDVKLYIFLKNMRSTSYPMHLALSAGYEVSHALAPTFTRVILSLWIKTSSAAANGVVYCTLMIEFTVWPLLYISELVITMTVPSPFIMVAYLRTGCAV